MSAAANHTPAPSLRQLQQRLAQAICYPGPDGAGTGDQVTGPTQASEHRLLAPTRGAPARLAVYQAAYASRLVGALRDNFDVLAQAMGDEQFDALGRAYLAAHPSTHASIRWFGDRLTGFMAALVTQADPRVPHPALVDLARMDWALRQAFDAADAPVLDTSALGRLAPGDWPGLRWQLHPSVQLLALQWAVAPAWHALRQAEGNNPPELPPPQASAHTLLVWRRGLETQWRVLDDGEAALLALVQDGGDFSAQCTLAAAQAAGPAQAVPRVVAAVQQWLAEGLLAGALA